MAAAAGKEQAMGNPIGHWELIVSDVDKAKAFYGSLFDWKFDDTSFPGYALIDTGSPPGGGLFKKPDEAPGYALNTYFVVGDIDATLQKASDGGAKVLMPKTEIPGIGHWAMLLDPDGIPISLLQPAPGM
jgi:predicted enzyme related to lactoylglutathione lyase